jgi:hypothetical protein
MIVLPDASCHCLKAGKSSLGLQTDIQLASAIALVDNIPARAGHTPAQDSGLRQFCCHSCQ